MVQPLWKTVWWLLKRLSIESPYDPAIPLPPGCIQEKLEHMSAVHTPPKPRRSRCALPGSRALLCGGRLLPSGATCWCRKFLVRGRGWPVLFLKAFSFRGRFETSEPLRRVSWPSAGEEHVMFLYVLAADCSSGKDFIFILLSEGLKPSGCTD